MPYAKALQFGRADLATGVTLHYALRGDVRAGSPVVLLHGFADSWQSFDLVLQALPENIAVLAPDLRGHGDSDRPSDGYAMADHAADVAALMETLGVSRATVAGHSMGSFAAQALAAAHPEKVEKLVLMASAPAANTPVILEFLDEVLALTDPIPRAFVAAFQDPSQPVPEDFLNEVIDQSLKLPAAVWKAALAGLAATDNRSLLPSIACPTALAWGENDGLFFKAAQNELLDRIANSTLWTYAAGHALHWERPADFARDLATFHAG